MRVVRSAFNQKKAKTKFKCTKITESLQRIMLIRPMREAGVAQSIPGPSMHRFLFVFCVASNEMRILQTKNINEKKKKNLNDRPCCTVFTVKPLMNKRKREDPFYTTTFHTARNVMCTFFASWAMFNRELKQLSSQ